MAEPLAPLVNHLSRPFWDAAEEGRLSLPCCSATNQFFWPPSPSSPFVAGAEVHWKDVPASGVVKSVVVYRRAFQKALAERVPYGIALVEVRPGVRLQAHLADPDTPSAPGPGDRVTLDFKPLRAGELPILFVDGVAKA